MSIPMLAKLPFFEVEDNSQLKLPASFLIRGAIPRDH